MLGLVWTSGTQALLSSSKREKKWSSESLVNCCKSHGSSVAQMRAKPRLFDSRVHVCGQLEINKRGSPEIHCRGKLTQMLRGEAVGSSVGLGKYYLMNFQEISHVYPNALQTDALRLC